MKILIFDCETSGLTPGWNKMLQLSWQLVDTCRWKVISRQNFYFRQPGKDKVEDGAIRVNGLTKERLAKLGTVPRSKAIQAFAKDMEQSDMCVAHNLDFDFNFIYHEDKKGLITWKKGYCTMHGTTNLCKIEFGYRPYWADDDQVYKWPKLIELARFLKVDYSKINLHDSAGDVELTKRCFRALIRIGHFKPKKSANITDIRTTFWYSR